MDVDGRKAGRPSLGSCSEWVGPSVQAKITSQQRQALDKARAKGERSVRKSKDEHLWAGVAMRISK